MNAEADDFVLHLASSGGRHAEVLSRTRVRIPEGTETSFAAYFNAFPASYWRRWSVLDAVHLRLRLSGAGRVDVYRSTARGVPVHVHGEVVAGDVLRDGAVGGDHAKGVERDQAGFLAGKGGGGLFVEEGDSGGGVGDALGIVAQRLAVGDVVAGAAPGVEQPDPLARGPVEQAAGGSEAFRATRDRQPCMIDKRRAIDGVHGQARAAFKDLPLASWSAPAPARDVPCARAADQARARQ